MKGTAAIVTGGTRGLGRAIGLALARAGASVFLTHRWGSVPEEEVEGAFRSEGLPPPRVVECDASDAAAIRALMTTVRDAGAPLRTVVSNVAFAKLVHEVEDLKRSSLELSLGYSAWPVVDLVQTAHAVLGTYPRYLIAVSSDGAEVCHPGYDLVGVSKAALETLCRYLALRLRPHGVRVNALRPGFLDTASARATLGAAFVEEASRSHSGLFLEPRAVADVCVALCSGLLDAVTGQVLVVDEGWSLVSPVAWLDGRALPPGFPRDETDR
jgi:NAD(P)-dependent dehydrogenase (short-subunit alcohol dehydrogenase family)